MTVRKCSTKERRRREVTNFSPT